jgi:hypothetical protein
LYLIVDKHYAVLLGDAAELLEKVDGSGHETAFAKHRLYYDSRHTVGADVCKEDLMEGVDGALGRPAPVFVREGSQVDF